MDATKCISYLTIESKTPAKESLREAIGDLFFGCDICQLVCPWNEKAFGKKEIKTAKADTDQLIEDLRFVLTSSNKQLMKTLAKTPLTRARGNGLKRNALIISGNLKLKSLKPEVETLLNHPRLGDLAKWSLNKINHPN
jgi:epoxyqueuosine reductase